MKKKIFYAVVLFFTSSIAIGQDDFAGVVRYRISIDSSNTKADSMTAIFDKQRIKVILYIPDSKDSKTVSEMVFIDDLKNNKSTSVNAKDKTYKTDTLNASSAYTFINTWKFEPSNSGALSIRYRADATKLDRSKVSKVDCLLSLDYLNTLIREYFFLGVQPLVVDNRIVMEFITTKKDGTRERTSVTDIKKMNNVDSYFDLKNYKQAK
jgi:hypothetical protein